MLVHVYVSFLTRTLRIARVHTNTDVLGLALGYILTYARHGANYIGPVMV